MFFLSDVAADCCQLTLNVKVAGRGNNGLAMLLGPGEGLTEAASLVFGLPVRCEQTQRTNSKCVNIFLWDFSVEFVLRKHEVRIFSAAAAARRGRLRVPSEGRQAQFCPHNGGRPRNWRPGLLRQHNTEVRMYRLLRRVTEKPEMGGTAMVPK